MNTIPMKSAAAERHADLHPDLDPDAPDYALAITGIGDHDGSQATRIYGYLNLSGEMVDEPVALSLNQLVPLLRAHDYTTPDSGGFYTQPIALYYDDACKIPDET